MPLLRKKEPVRRLPFNEWIPPPMGSAGDAWDERIEIPKNEMELLQGWEPPKPSEKRKQRKKKKGKSGKLREGEIRFLKSRPKLHMTAVFAWVFFFFALTSFGPVEFLRIPWAALSIAFATGCFYAVRRNPLQGGRVSAAVAGVLSVMLILAVLAAEEDSPLANLIPEPAPAPQMVEQTIKEVIPEMQLFRDLALCLKDYYGKGVVTAQGELAANRRFGPGSPLWFIPTLKLNLTYQPIEEEAIISDIYARDLPADPFSLQLGGTYGYFERGNWGVVWSPGPDRDIDYQLRRQFNPDQEDFFSSIITSLYDPTNGTVSSGDLFVLTDFETAKQPDCEAVYEQIRSRK